MLVFGAPLNFLTLFFMFLAIQCIYFPDSFAVRQVTWNAGGAPAPSAAFSLTFIGLYGVFFYIISWIHPGPFLLYKQRAIVTTLGPLP